MPRINLPISEVYELVSYTNSSSFVIEYTYFPAIPIDPIEEIEKEPERIVLKSVKNEYGEEILDTLNKNVLSLLRKICKKDADLGLSQLSAYYEEVKKIREYNSEFDLTLGD